MLEDTLDPRPQPELFAKLMSARVEEHGYTPTDLARWLRGWHDRAGSWTTLRDLEHWMSRAAG
jgi:hypothetical protein